MTLTLRLLARNAAAYALFALAPLAAYSQEASTPETHGIVVANMDRSVKPGDDFYRYANGAWLKRTEIPPDRRYIDPNGLDFDGSNDLSRKRIASLIEEAAKANAPAGSKTRKIADFYHSYMDEATIEAKGLAPLRPHLDAIAAIRDKHDLARTLGESLRADVDALNLGPRRIRASFIRPICFLSTNPNLHAMTTRCGVPIRSASRSSLTVAFT